MLCINSGREKPKRRGILNNVVPKWEPKWRELGTQLNVDRYVMDTIEKDHPKDCKGCCIEMFSRWLNSNCAACWEDITTAMDNLLVAGMCVFTIVNCC